MDISKLSVRTAEKAQWMHIKLNEKAKASLKLRMPHQPKPLTVKKVESLFPEFAKELDGKLSDSTIDYFWKLSKATGVYEFVDKDAKEEVAELMGVAPVDYKIPNDEEEDPASRRQLTEQEIQDFREYLADAKEGRKKLGWE